MARLYSIASGNFTDASTWGTALASLYTDTEVAAHSITQAGIQFVSHVPGAVTLSGIAIKLSNRASSPSGTFTLTLRNVTTSTDITSVTVNVSDLPSATTAGRFGWHYFKFSANQTLTAGQSYALKMACSVTGQVTVFASSATPSAATVAQAWITTTTAAPVTGDTIHIGASYLSAGSKDTITVTMNNTSTSLDVGSGLTTYAESTFTINNGGILQCGTNAATNYALKFSTNPRVYSGGIWRTGQRGGTAIPSDSTVTYTMDCLTDNDYRIFVEEGGTFQAYWDHGTKALRCKLNTDEAAAQTVLGVDTDTGWVNGDLIQIAQTNRNATLQDERRTVSSSTSTTVTISAGLTNSHSGSAPLQADVALLTRGIKFVATTSTLSSGLECATTSTVDIYGAEFRYFSQSTGQGALNIKTTAGSALIEKCSVYDAEMHGIYMSGTALNNVTIKDCNISEFNTSNSGAIGIYIAQATSGTNWTIDGNLVIGEGAANGTGIYVIDEGGTLQNNIVSGVSSAYGLGETNPITSFITANNIAYGCSSFGLQIVNYKGDRTYSGFKMYRCNSYGAYLQTHFDGITIDSSEFLGNSTNFAMAGGTSVQRRLIFTNCTFAGQTGNASTYGFNVLGTYALDYEFINCSFGVVSGSNVAHTSGDINIANVGTPQALVRIDIVNTNLASATEISGNTTMRNGSYIRAMKKDQTAGLHHTWVRQGQISPDTGTYKTASPALKLQPALSGEKLESAIKEKGALAPIDNGNTRTVSVWVRKNTGYTGAQPRLILRKNLAIGITLDTVLDTLSVGANTWEELTGTTNAADDDGFTEFIVDCDGTAGSVFVDDFSFS